MGKRVESIPKKTASVWSITFYLQLKDWDWPVSTFISQFGYITGRENRAKPDSGASRVWSGASG